MPRIVTQTPNLLVSVSLSDRSLASLKHLRQRRLLDIRHEVPVATTHFVGGVADPGIDEALVDAFAGAIADETVAEDVPTAEFFPLAAGERSLEMILGFAGRQWLKAVPFLAAA